MEYIESQHTGACQDNHKFIVTVQAEMDHYRRKWPHHCKTCGGTGWCIDPGDPDVGMQSFWYICPDCVMKGQCPRCGDWHGQQIEEDDDIEHEQVTCGECGVVIGHDNMCLGALQERLYGLPDCMCGDPWR